VIDVIASARPAALAADWPVSSSRGGVARPKTVFQLKQMERTAIFSVTA
jgi:hypothetical protein